MCHSDHSLLTTESKRPWFQDKYILVQYLFTVPVTLLTILRQGHEGCGEIVQIGDEVKESGFDVVISATYFDKT